MNRNVLFLCVAWATTHGLSAARGDTAPIDVLLRSGTQAPNTESGALFANFSAPVTNDPGTY
ncbi:MAG: hypothetical protein ACK58T_04170, partial [Phycisphaerae bacterium]